MKDVVDLAKEITHLFMQNEQVQNNFTAEISFLQDRIQIWSSRTWRVGLIGITSSGKSTILNALLGGDILPSGVRPSSNCLIKCQKGSRLSCEVVYANNSKQRYHGDRGEISRIIKRLGDERRNIRNREGIKEITLRSPSFLLSQNIVIVDSPGLDAFGHEDHEKVTLQQLVPTVDMVLYTTCTKASSDERLGFYLNYISKRGKPVLLLQNKIDSVRAKRGNFGKVLKSKEQVLFEHQKRLENAIQRSGGQELLSQVRIFQISAKNSLLGKKRESNILNFTQGIQDCIQKLTPKFNAERYHQLFTFLQDIIKREEQLLSKSPVEAQHHFAQQRQRYQDLEKKTEKMFNQIEKQFSAHLKSRVSLQKQYLREIAQLTEQDFVTADEIKTKIENWHKHVVQGISSSINESQHLISQQAEQLNLRPEDFIIQLSGQLKGTGSLLIKRKTKSETYKKKVRKKGLLGYLPFGWGKKTVTKTRSWDVINISEFRNDATKILNRGTNWLESKTNELLLTFSKQCDVFSRQLAINLQGVEEKQKANLELSERKDILKQLQTYLVQIERYNPKVNIQLQKNKVSARKGQYEHLKMPSQSYNQVHILVGMAERIIHRRKVAFRQKVLGFSKNDRYILWGWSPDSLMESLDMFFPEIHKQCVVATPAFSTEYLSLIKTESMQCNIVNAQIVETSYDRSNLQFLFYKPAVHLIIVNTAQIGSTRNQLARSSVSTIPKNHRIILILQGFDECLSGSQMGEMISEFIAFARSFSGVVGWAALYPKLNYSLLLEQIRREPHSFQTQQGEMDFIEMFSSKKAASLGEVISAEWLVELLRELKSLQKG